MLLQVSVFDELIDHVTLTLMGDTERLNARERIGGVELSKHFLQ